MAAVGFTVGTSTDASKHCLAAALTALNCQTDADVVLSEKAWRTNYYKHFLKWNQRALEADGRSAVVSCRAGLAAVGAAFSCNGIALGNIPLIPPTASSGTTVSASAGTSRFGARIVVGKGSTQPFSCPLNKEELGLSALGDALEKLVSAGAAEPSVVASIRTLQQHPDWFDRDNSTTGLQQCVTSLHLRTCHIFGQQPPS